MNERANADDELPVRSRVPASTHVLKDQNRASSDWIDIDEERPRRRRRSRQQPSESAKSSRQVKTKHQTNAQGDIGRFLPKLGRILEATDPSVRQKSSVQGSKSSKDFDDRNRSGRHKESTDSIYRHPPRRTRSVQRRPEPIPGVNQSLLSVLSSLTGVSERSSESTSTITQQSYNRKRGIHSRTMPSKSRRADIASEQASARMPRMRSPNVFDYMEEANSADEHENQSVISPASSVSSHYQGSDAGSSEGPGTPSSRSTMPSPTVARNASVSVAELRRKYDSDHASSTKSHASNSDLNSSIRSVRRQGNFKGVNEQDSASKEATSPWITSSRSDLDGSARQGSHGSLHTLDGEQRLLRQEEAMRQHMAYSQHPYSYDFSPTSDPPHTQPSPAPEPPCHPHHQSLQHYIHQPVPTRPNPPKVVRSTPSPADGAQSSIAVPHYDPPHVPDAPDYTKTTLAGYELMAAHLVLAPHSSNTEAKDFATREPQLTPLYRKFSHLHHRILLQIQDELSEMEAQLRVYDEIAAQTYTTPPASPPTSSASPYTNTTSSPQPPAQPQPQQQTHHPASRRAETHPQSHPIFAHRTRLLGNIFLKQQQYHTALRDYNSLARDSRPAANDEVEAYRTFMKERKPVWEGEAQFLDRAEDLIVPIGAEGGGEESHNSGKMTRPTKHRSNNSKKSNSGPSSGSDTLLEQILFLTALLLLPLLLSAVLPDFASRAAATALLGAGAGLVVWGARLRGGRMGAAV